MVAEYIQKLQYKIQSNNIKTEKQYKCFRPDTR